MNSTPGTVAMKLAITILSLIFFALEVTGSIKVSWTAVVLLVIAFLPWAAPWLESVRVGDFEAKFRELRSEVAAARKDVDETRREVDTLKAAYQAMDTDYLAACAEFDPEASPSQLNDLASRLKARARGLRAIEFLFQGIDSEKDEGRVFGAACALHVRPQFEAIAGVTALIDKLASDVNLMRFRLKTVYRLLMAVDEIVKLDQRNKGTLLNEEQRTLITAALERMRTHSRCASDDTGELCARIVRKLAKPTAS